MVGKHRKNTTRKKRKERAVASTSPPVRNVITPEMARMVSRNRLIKLTDLRTQGYRTEQKTDSISDHEHSADAKLEKSANAVIARLPETSFPDLLGIRRNAIRKLSPDAARYPQHPAMRVIVAVESEWQRRGGKLIDPTEYFNWPSTEASGGSHNLVLPGLLPEGMLQYLDYRVGRTNGEATPIRHAILRRVFEGTLPPVFPADYMASWGKPKSVHRLQKMAESIAAFTRNAKRRHDSRMDDAIKHWEDDLRFLYDAYYVGHFHFGWPDTTV